MKMQITVTDRDGWVLASHVFEITGLSDYQQATHYIRDRVRESLTKRSDESDLELARKLQASPEPPARPDPDYQPVRRVQTTRGSRAWRTRRIPGPSPDNIGLA